MSGILFFIFASCHPLSLHSKVFADIVIHHIPLCYQVYWVMPIPVLNHDQTDHNTNPVEHWCIATAAWTSYYCMMSSLSWRITISHLAMHYGRVARPFWKQGPLYHCFPGNHVPYFKEVYHSVFLYLVGPLLNNSSKYQVYISINKLIK